MFCCEKVSRRYWKVNEHALSLYCTRISQALFRHVRPDCEDFGSSWFYALMHISALDKDRGCDIGPRLPNRTRAGTPPRPSPQYH